MMPESQDVIEKPSAERSGWIGAFIIGYGFACLVAVPICLLSLQRGIAVGLIFAPVFTLLAYNLGGLSAFAQYIGLLVVALLLGTVNKIIPIRFLLPSDPDSEGLDSVTKSEIDTRLKVMETDSDEEFDRLAEILRARDRFIRNRRIVLIIGLIVAAIGTALVHWDAMQLREGNQSVLVPSEWKEIKAENYHAAFPVIFVLVCVPLCVVFASYPLWYVCACVGGSFYFGTAFYLLFQASTPELSYWILPLSILVLFAGLGLAIEWVTAESETEGAAQSAA